MVCLRATLLHNFDIQLHLFCSAKKLGLLRVLQIVVLLGMKINNEFDAPVPINLSQLQLEVLSRGADKALPSTLSDYWLQAISENMDYFPKAPEETKSEYFSGPLLIIVSLLMFGGRNKALEIDSAEMLTRFHEYRLEMALEEVARASGIKIAPVTMETLFTNARAEFVRAQLGFKR